MGKQLVIIGADFSAVAIGDAKVLSSLAITTPPTKTTYTQGESFDPTGMVVRATYTDGTTSTSINYTYSPTILNIVQEISCALRRSRQDARGLSLRFDGPDDSQPHGPLRGRVPG